MNEDKPTLRIAKRSDLVAVWWDGSFKAADLLRRYGVIPEGMKHTTCGGELVLLTFAGELLHIPRNCYVVRDGDLIKKYSENGDSLLSNEYEILGEVSNEKHEFRVYEGTCHKCGVNRSMKHLPCV